MFSESSLSVLWVLSESVLWESSESSLDILHIIVYSKALSKPATQNSLAKRLSDNHSAKASHLSDLHFSWSVSFLRSFPLGDHHF